MSLMGTLVNLSDARDPQCLCVAAFNVAHLCIPCNEARWQQYEVFRSWLLP